MISHVWQSTPPCSDIMMSVQVALYTIRAETCHTDEPHLGGLSLNKMTTCDAQCVVLCLSFFFWCAHVFIFGTIAPADKWNDELCARRWRLKITNYDLTAGTPVLWPHLSGLARHRGQLLLQLPSTSVWPPLSLSLPFSLQPCTAWPNYSPNSPQANAHLKPEVQRQLFAGHLVWLADFIVT